MAGLRSDNVYDPDYVPPSTNEPDVLPGGRPERPMPKPRSEFEKGLERGINTLQADAYGAVEAAGKAIDSDYLQEFGAEGYQRNIEEASAVPPANVESVFDIDSVHTFLDWAAHGLGQLAPSALTMAGTGGAGALVGGAMKAARAGAAIGAFSGSAVPQTGSAYKEMQAEGVENPGMAALEGGIIGLLDVAPQAHLLNVLGTAVPKRGVLRGVARGVLDQAPREAITEAGQEGVSEAFRSSLIPGYDNPNLIRELIEAGSLGALGGGFAGGVGGGIRGGLQREQVQGLPEPAIAASQGLISDLGNFAPDELPGTELSATDQELKALDDLGFEPRELQLDVPVTTTKRLSGSARELLGMPADEYAGNLEDQLGVLNQPFIDQQQAAYDVERAGQPSVPDMLASVGALREGLQDRKINEVFTVAKTGDLEGLETELPDMLNRILVPEKAGEQVPMRTLLQRLDNAEKQLAEADLGGIDETAPEFRGPFERETLLQRTEREALAQFPDDVELQQSLINQRGEELFAEESGANTNLKIIDLLKEQGKIRPHQILDPVKKQTANARLKRIEDQLESLRSKERIAKRTGVSWIYDPANPGSFLANYESIKSPALTEVRDILETQDLAPEVRTQFNKLLQNNRDENAGESLAGANIGRQGQNPKHIFFQVTDNYNAKQYPGQVRIGNNVLNMRNLTSFARKERQREELTTPQAVTGRPREATGERTSAMRLFNDVMLGLEMAAEQGIIQLPKASNIQAILAPGALKAAAEKGTAERQESQLALNELVKIIGADTVVAGDKKNNTAKTFLQVLQGAKITDRFRRGVAPFDFAEFEADQAKQNVEPELMQEESELRKKRMELDRPNVAPNPKKQLSKDRYAAREISIEADKRRDGLVKTLDTLQKAGAEPEVIARATADVTTAKNIAKVAREEWARLETLLERRSFYYPYINFTEKGVPKFAVLNLRDAKSIEEADTFELRGDGGSVVVRPKGKGKVLWSTSKFKITPKQRAQFEKDKANLARSSGIPVNKLDEMLAASNSSLMPPKTPKTKQKASGLVAIPIEAVTKVQKQPAAPATREPTVTTTREKKGLKKGAPQPKVRPVTKPKLSTVEQYQKRRDAISDLTADIAVTKEAAVRADKLKRLKKMKAEHKKLSEAAAKAFVEKPGPKASTSIRQTYENTKQLLENKNEYAENIAKEYFKKIRAPQSVYLMSSGQASKYLTKEMKLDWLQNLATGTLHGFATPVENGRIGVYVRPGLSEQLTREVLAHEIGHAVYGGYVHTLNDSMARKVMQEYLSWRKKYGKDNTTIEELLRSKKQPKSVLLTLAGADGNARLDQLTDKVRDYMLDFEEWFADSASRWFTETRQPRTGIERFFKAIADTLRSMVGIAPKGNINSLMDALAGGRRSWDLPFSPQVGMAASASLPIPTKDIELIKKLAPDAKLADLMTKEDVEYGVYVATLEDQDPYGHVFHNAFYEFLLDERVKSATSNVLFNAAKTKHVQNQMRTLFQHDRQALEQLDNPFDATAYMYQLWRAGLINLGPRTDTIFQRIRTFFRKVMGIVAQSERAVNLFRAIEQSMTPFDAAVHRSAVAKILPNSIAENVIETFQPSYELAMKLVRPLFLTVDNRVHAFEIPALSEIANQFHNRPGEMRGNPTFQAGKQLGVRFENRMRRIFDGKDAKFGNEALDYLYQSKPLSEAPPGVQRVVQQVRDLFAEMRKYQRDAGVDTRSHIKNYFPWMLNQDALSSKTDEFRTVLAQDKYKSKREDLAAFMNFRQHKRWMIKQYDGLGEKALEDAFKKLAKTGEWSLSYRDEDAGVTLNITQPENLLDSDTMVDYMVRSAMSEGSMDFEISEDRQVPVMRFNNPRLFKFVDPVEMRPFLNNNIGEVTGMYISQAVKHAEYTRRFGENGQNLENLLQQAETQGATPMQRKATVNYVKASMGTYGRHTAEWLHRWTGMALPEHQFSPINAGLNKAMGVAIVYQNLRYLALSTLTSLADVMGIAVRSSEMGSIVRATKAFMQRNKTNLNDLGEMLGIIEHSQVADALGWRYDGMHLTGKLRKFNDGFFRVIGLQAWTRTTRLMGLAAAEAFIVKHSQRPNKHSQRWMNELNLTKDDVKLRKDGSLRVFSHAERLRASEAEVARDDRIRSALVQWTDEAILRPNPSMRTLWGSDPHFQLFQYLKSFMYTFHERILKRVGHEAMEGNYAVFIGLLSYIPAMIAADLLRELIQYGSAGDPRKANWSAGDYIQHGAVRGGLLGYAQQGVDIHKDLKWGGYGVSGMAATFDTIASIPDLVTMQPGAVTKALPGQTVFGKWFD